MYAAFKRCDEGGQYEVGTLGVHSLLECRIVFLRGLLGPDSTACKHRFSLKAYVPLSMSNSSNDELGDVFDYQLLYRSIEEAAGESLEEHVHHIAKALFACGKVRAIEITAVTPVEKKEETLSWK